MIRRATIDDIEELILLAHKQYELSQFIKFNFDFDIDKLAQSLVFYITNENALALIAEEDGEVTGYFYGIQISPMYSTVRQAVEMAMFVNPEYRGKQIGKQLVNEFINWGKESNIKVFQIENSTHADPERIAKLYQHYGFNKIGGTYQMIIEEE